MGQKLQNAGTSCMTLGLFAHYSWHYCLTSSRVYDLSYVVPTPLIYPLRNTTKTRELEKKTEIKASYLPDYLSEQKKAFLFVYDCHLSNNSCR